jgi:uncharacterized protein YbaP (TraB family)
MTNAILLQAAGRLGQILSRGLRATLAVALLSAMLPTAQAAGGPLPMWEIRSTASKGTVYLLGSIHVCRESCLQFSESILRRFRSSQALVLELDPTNADLATKMMSAMALPPGQTLSSKLSAAQSRKLQNVSNMLGLPAQMFDGMQPVMVETTLSMLAAQKQGLTIQDGIDMWFLEQAQATGKPVRELETMERQLAALSAGSERDQIASLEDTLDLIEKNRIGAYFEDMVQAWQSGNLTKLSSVMMMDMKNSPTIEQELLGKRNVEMADKLSQWLSHGDQLFVVIGAGHIAGNNNVAELLSRKGFSVRQVNDGE